MRPQEKLIDEPAWPMLSEWIASASNPIEALPAREPSRSRVLFEAHATTRLPLGAVVYNTGGILVDHGWLRLLGSGHERLPRTLSEWNRSVAAGDARSPDG